MIGILSILLIIGAGALAGWFLEYGKYGPRDRP